MIDRWRTTFIFVDGNRQHVKEVQKPGFRLTPSIVPTIILLYLSRNRIVSFRYRISHWILASLKDVWKVGGLIFWIGIRCRLIWIYIFGYKNLFLVQFFWIDQFISIWSWATNNMIERWILIETFFFQYLYSLKTIFY